MTKTLEEIIEAIKKRKKVLEEKYKVKEIGIFGSYVRGEQTERSDVDILVDFYQLPDVFDLLKLERSLRGILRCRVDVIRNQAIRKELRDQILSEVIRIWREPSHAFILSASTGAQ
jgi:predicted nucleotidyltransferase